MRVDFLDNAHDMQAAVLGQLGFKTEYIAAQTGLSVGQVLYRLNLRGIRRASYRDGSSASAQLVLRLAMTAARTQERNAITASRRAENGRHPRQRQTNGVA